MEIENIRFHPAIHDKEFILNNINYAAGWVKFDVSFQQSQFAQDFDILAKDDGIVAMQLAINSPTWASTPAAQDEKVLKLRNENVAHLLASKREWAKTDAAQNYDILSLCKGKVATVLAKTSEEWACTAAAQDINVLSLNDGKVVCELILHSSGWLETDASYNKNVLMLNPKALIAISQYFSKTCAPEAAVETITELVHRYIVVGAIECILPTKALEADPPTTSAKDFGKPPYVVDVPHLISRLDEDLLLLCGEIHLLDNAVLLARTAIAFNILPNIYLECANTLQDKSVQYTNRLASLLSTMTPAQIEQLYTRCKSKDELAELEFLNKISLAPCMDNFQAEFDLLGNKGKNSPATPIFY